MRKTMMMLTGAAMLALAAPASAATIVLTFDQANSCVPANNLGATPGPCTFTGAAISPTYGSTAEVNIGYRNYNASGGLSNAHLDYATPDAAYATGSNGGPEATEFLFTPAAGFQVSVGGFDFYRATGTDSGTIELFDAANTLLFSTTQAITTTPSLVAINSAFSSGLLRLRVTALAGTTYDNVTLNTRVFAAPGGVPEPASWAMMVAGFGLLGGAVRRRAAARSPAMA